MGCLRYTHMIKSIAIHSVCDICSLLHACSGTQDMAGDERNRRSLRSWSGQASPGWGRPSPFPRNTARLSSGPTAGVPSECLVKSHMCDSAAVSEDGVPGRHSPSVPWPVLLPPKPGCASCDLCHPLLLWRGSYRPDSCCPSVWSTLHLWPASSLGLTLPCFQSKWDGGGVK